MYLEMPSIDMGEIGNLFVLRPEHVTDRYVSWLNASDTNKYLESRFFTHSITSTRAFVNSVLESPNSFLWGINSYELGLHVGNIKLGPIDPHHITSDVGILIGDKNAWGKGIATAAIKAVSEIAATHLKLRKITAGCYASNIGSKKAFEKAGFLIEGTRRAQFLLDSNAEDLILMGRILR